jgi:hypothetical protein
MLRTWAAAIAAVLLLLTGCSDNKVNGTQKKEKQVTKVEQKQEENKTSYPYKFPLTGKGSNTETDGRAIAVMVNNHPKARPQSGLTKADIVYEILAEGDITRFLAVFQSEKPETIGPVRSARKYYMEIAKGLNALFVNHGTSLEAENMIKAGYIDDLDGMVYDGTLFKRATFRQAPHNSYITYENILKGARLKHYTMNTTPPAFQFMTEEQAKTIAGNTANKVSITYSSSHISDSSFEYDPSLGRYKRFSGGEQTVDYDTKEPVLIDNVFIIEANHQIADSVGHRSIDLLSGGKAYLLQKGKMNEVEWAFRNDRIVPMKNGEEIPFVEGHTWVNVVPTNPGLDKAVSFNR